MPTRDNMQAAFVRQNFQTVWPVHLDGFTRLLVQLRTRFDGDLDLVLVLAIIGSRTPPERWTSALTELGRLTDADRRNGNQVPINLQSVADFSGIPRETVRRKVNLLQDRGWVTKEVDGRLAVTRRAAEDLQGATRDTLAYLSSLLIAFEAARAKEGDHEEQ
ncbi:helix-turn-helix domain-containing protein [Jannaschia seohaensis]|uniref:HTH crp-type domain-containing protein n=1 Tax=Jannaschia seohaensis TaxID=475081 RepID=A0A2Y9BXM2_9RHOB|nr:helix-turn-helix domain-containing protein [Jannaschia seohaensis]PWJ20758.1 hypothetical protein BCF38_1023 [Jannaschia seohaensis]SSA41082.1 hypothetical protein SAMN05421539_1023 [Jannaschia seohaensis]